MRSPLAALLLLASIALIWILLPFYGTILWAVIIAVIFSPLYRWLLPRVWGRNNIAAGVTLIIVFAIAILPVALLAGAMMSEASLIINNIESGKVNPQKYFQSVFDALPNSLVALLDRFGLFNLASIQKRLTLLLSQASQFIATQVLTIGQITLEFVIGVFITQYLAFFFIRDGAFLTRVVRHALPLPQESKRELIEKFSTVIRATIKGNIFIAAIQGSLGGFAFWFLDISGALLWGLSMAVLSLIPAVGAGLIWAPVAIYLIATGAVWEGALLITWGVLIIGLVDNLLRPVLIGKDIHLPDYVVMITTLGGLAVFGINGFVLGPVIAAMFFAVWHIHSTQLRSDSPE